MTSNKYQGFYLFLQELISRSVFVSGEFRRRAAVVGRGEGRQGRGERARWHDHQAQPPTEHHAPL